MELRKNGKTMEEKIETREEMILEQWRTCAELANSVSERRDNMNNLFVVLNTAIIATVSFVWDVKTIALMVLGILMCVVWLLMIKNFKALNAAKFHVINDMEKELPVQAFTKEWESLEGNEDYYTNTELEGKVPCIFIAMYIAVMVVLCISALR